MYGYSIILNKSEREKNPADPIGGGIGGNFCVGIMQNYKPKCYTLLLRILSNPAWSVSIIPESINMTHRSAHRRVHKIIIPHAPYYVLSNVPMKEVKF